MGESYPNKWETRQIHGTEHLPTRGKPSPHFVTQRVVNPSEAICEKGELHASHVARLGQVREQPISVAWCTLREDP